MYLCLATLNPKRTTLELSMHDKSIFWYQTTRQSVYKKKNYVIQFHSSALLLSVTSYSKLYTGEEVRLKFKATEPAKIG